MTSSATAALRARVLPAALAADAATMPLHWIYGVGSVRTALAAHPDADVAFFPKLSCPFYSSETHPGHYAKVGDPSPYGEEAMALVEYVAVAGKGEFASAEGWADALDAWARAPGGGRLNGCSVQFLKNRDAKAPHPQGADDPQMNGTVKAVVLAAKYGGRGDAAKLASVVEQAVRVHQNNQKAVDAGVTAALVIDALLSGAAKTPLEAATHAPAHTPDSMRPWFDLAARVAKDEGRASIADPDRLFERVIKHLRTLPTFDADLAHLMTFMKEESRALGGMASSCGVPNAMGVCLLIAVASDSYEDAIRLNARFGGDNCSRAMFLGALFAAAGSPVPSDWLARTSLLSADRVEAKWVAEIGRA